MPASRASSPSRIAVSGRVRGGLEDRGVPGGQRRRDLPRGHEDREVPRHDQPDDADRLAQGEVEAGLRDRDRLAEDLVGGARRSSRTRGWPRRPRRARREIGLPPFWLSSWASSSLWSLSSARELRERAAALAGGPVAQPLRSSKAACAAATARSTSSRPPSGAVAMTAPVAGLTTSNVPPSAASTDCPPMTMSGAGPAGAPAGFGRHGGPRTRAASVARFGRGVGRAARASRTPDRDSAGRIRLTAGAGDLADAVGVRRLRRRRSLRR